jgi:ferredoxin-NADP reductase
MSVPQKIRCKVVGVNDHGGHVYTLELKPERPAPEYLPGQFMHLAVDSYEPGDFWPESRVFSIASTPKQRVQLSITYSVVGSFTTKMEQRIKVGTEVWAKLPYGDFVIQSKSEVVLIAGGTGITAFTSFLDGLTPDQEQTITLFYGARNRELLIYKPLVERKMKEVTALSAWYFIEEGEPDEKDRVLYGRLSWQSIMLKVIHPINTDFYLSGPPGMLKIISNDLKSQAITADHIKIDAWE